MHPIRQRRGEHPVVLPQGRHHFAPDGGVVHQPMQQNNDGVMGSVQ